MLRLGLIVVVVYALYVLTACVLARNNAFGIKVPLSMRSVKNERGLGLSSVVPGEIPQDGIPSTERCGNDPGPANAEERNCGKTKDA